GVMTCWEHFAMVSQYLPKSYAVVRIISATIRRVPLADSKGWISAGQLPRCDVQAAVARMATTGSLPKLDSSSRHPGCLPCSLPRRVNLPGTFPLFLPDLASGLGELVGVYAPGFCRLQYGSSKCRLSFERDMTSRDKYAVFSIDSSNELAFDPVPMIAQQVKGRHVDGDAVPFHLGRRGHVTATQQSAG